MSLWNSESESQRGLSWLRVAGIALVQILVLIALGALVLRYLEWSSDANKAEFLSSTQPSVSDRNHLPLSSVPFERVKARPGCYRKT